MVKRLFQLCTTVTTCKLRWSDCTFLYWLHTPGIHVQTAHIRKSGGQTVRWSDSQVVRRSVGQTVRWCVFVPCIAYPCVLDRIERIQAYSCLFLLICAYSCLFLHFLAYLCVIERIWAYSCAALLVLACSCVFLLICAYSCLFLHFLAYLCVFERTLAYLCVLERIERIQAYYFIFLHILALSR